MLHEIKMKKQVGEGNLSLLVQQVYNKQVFITLIIITICNKINEGQRIAESRFHFFEIYWLVCFI